jgi:hypothetical protein
VNNVHLLLYLLEAIGICNFNRKALAYEANTSALAAGEDNLEEGDENFTHQTTIARTEH